MSSMIQAKNNESWHWQSREVARAAFFNEHLNYDKIQPDEAQQKLKTAALWTATAITDYAVTSLIFNIFYYSPWVQQELNSLETMYQVAVKSQAIRQQVIRRLETLKDPRVDQVADFTSDIHRFEQEKEKSSSLLKSTWTALFVFLFPIIYHTIASKWDTYQGINTYILNNYVENWPTYKACTPSIFHAHFDLLYKLFLARNHRLEIDDEDAQSLIKLLLIENQSHLLQP